MKKTKLTKKQREAARKTRSQNYIAVCHWLDLTRARATELALLGLHEAAERLRELASRRFTNPLGED
jgi:hypothetical protein